MAQARITGWIWVGAAVIGLAVSGSALAGDIIFKVYSDGWSVPVDREAAAKAPKAPVSKSLTVNGLTFNITYEDDGTGIGFDDPVEGSARKARAEAALATVAQTLNQPGTLDVELNGTVSIPGQTLATGGTFFSSTAGFSNGSAFQRLQTGSKPFAGVPEVFVEVDLEGKNFYTGQFPSGIGGGEVDLETVMLHEYTHALGFLSLSDANGENAFQVPSPGVYTVFDSLMRRGTGSGALVLFENPQPVFGATFQGTPADLVSEDLFFDGPESTSAYGSNPPLHAPPVFAPGSSLSHWDADEVPFTAVMTPAIFAGTVNREYPAFELAALADLGWENVLDDGGNGGDPGDPGDPPLPGNPFPEAPSGTPAVAPAALLVLAAGLLGAGLAVRSRRRTP